MDRKKTPATARCPGCLIRELVQYHFNFENIMPPVIQVSGVRKTYGRTVAVDEVSFEVNDGEIFGLIGPNGAEKTTTMECIEGLRTPDRGTISVLGLDPFRQVYKLQDRIGVQLQQAQLQKRIKVWEAVDLWASLYKKKSADEERFRTIPRIESVVRSDLQFTIRGRGDDLVTEVIHCLSESRIRVTDFRMIVPNLEDVFLKLTGHSIRD